MVECDWCNNTAQVEYYNYNDGYAFICYACAEAAHIDTSDLTLIYSSDESSDSE